MKFPQSLPLFMTCCAALSCGFLGCNKTAPLPAKAVQTTEHAPHPGHTDGDNDPDHVKQTGEAAHDHGGWWCAEHGVPEESCGQCDTKLAAAFQKKGDWCKDHDRPDSQCFVCHPELEIKFAAQYEAKYGKAPPKPTVN